MSDEEVKAQLEEDIKNCQEEINTRNECEDDMIKDTSGATTVTCSHSKVKSAITADSKVSAASWWKDDEHICVVLQDGKIIIHNAKVPKNSKCYFLSMNTWIMAAEFSPSGDKLAVGGLDNICTIYDIPDLTAEDIDPVPDVKPKHTLEKHGGYLNTCKWLTNEKIITGSGDCSSMLWDLGSFDRVSVKEPTRTFLGHSKDVAALDTWAGEENMFISGSSDTYAKLWDIRVNETNGCVATFNGHLKAVTSVRKIHGVDAFVTGSEDGSCRMFDMRAMKCVQLYGTPSEEDDDTTVTVVNMSKSGRLLFAGDNQGGVTVYDMLTAEVVESLNYHNAEMSVIEMSHDGLCLATGSRSTTNNFTLWA